MADAKAMTDLARLHFKDAATLATEPQAVTATA